jgi:ankyrin repeat protein
MRHSKYHYPKYYAARNGHIECLQMLIDAHADVNHAGALTPLMIAAARGNGECLRALINAGANVNAVHLGTHIR